MYLVLHNAISAVNMQPFMLYLFWTSMHYMSVHIYTEYCTHWSLYGFITSPFYTMNPICRGLNWFIYESSLSINQIFVTIGAFMVLNLQNNMNIKRDI